MLSPTIKALNKGEGFSGTFHCMASDCEVLLLCTDALLAKQIIDCIFAEAKRIEAKFSRYLSSNTLYKINHHQGQPVTVDKETALLINFAFSCYQLSDGLFDITSGVLGKVWLFDGSANVPTSQQIAALLPLVGLDKVRWQAPLFTLPKGMQLDFGGIGKEYAVDSCLQKALQINASMPILLNFGGDLICNGPRLQGKPWQVGIENVAGGPATIIALKTGALATSGDANRYLLKNGVRYSHILNPLTGFSVVNAPRSITVAAGSCIEAGLLSTMAMLQGEQAAEFLNQQQIDYWLQE